MRIAVLGAGHMGAWFASELAVDNNVAVFDVDRDKVNRLAGNTYVHVLEAVGELEKFNPEMLLNAVSLQNTIDAFKVATPYISDDCIIADVTSIKGDLPEYYKTVKFRYVSVHPMFGPTFANLDALKEENAVIIKESDPEGAAFFLKFFKDRELKIFEYTADEHDEMMAYSLSLPFVSSMVFAACMKEKVAPGSTFAKHRRIATGLLSEDDRLLSEILFNDNSLEQLQKVTARLEFLKHIIMGKDYEEAKRFFDKLRKNIR